MRAYMLYGIASCIGLSTLNQTEAQLADIGKPVLPDVLTTLLDAYKPLLSSYAQETLPATIGNCKDGSPPLNCTDVGNLYEDKQTFYRVKARWVSGINTLQLNDISIHFDSTGTMSLKLNVSFAQLPASLHVEACAGALGCISFLDNTKTCCGMDKTVTITATAKCSEEFPFLNSFAITEAKITPAISLTLNVLGHPFKVADVTPHLTQGIKESAGTFLATKGMDLFNQQIKSLFGDKVYCSRASYDAQEPSKMPVTLPPTMTPLPEQTAQTPTTPSLTPISSSSSIPTSSTNKNNSSKIPSSGGDNSSTGTLLLHLQRQQGKLKVQVQLDLTRWTAETFPWHFCCF